MNKHISQFNWSNKTNTKLMNLGINTIENFNNVSIKALEEIGIPKTVIKQIKDICKVHNIKTKETEYTLKIYEVQIAVEDILSSSNEYSRKTLIIANTPEEAIEETKKVWKHELLKEPKITRVMGPIKPGYRLF